MLRCLDILRVIERDWEFMEDEACVPVKVALQLMDTSSLGMASKYTSFKETHRDLQYALQAIVNGTMVVFCFPSGLSNLQQITTRDSTAPSELSTQSCVASPPRSRKLEN